MLEQVLEAYVCYRPDVGYVQGTSNTPRYQHSYVQIQHYPYSCTRVHARSPRMIGDLPVNLCVVLCVVLCVFNPCGSGCLACSRGCAEEESCMLPTASVSCNPVSLSPNHHARDHRHTSHHVLSYVGMSYLGGMLVLNLESSLSAFSVMANLLNQDMYFTFFSMRMKHMKIHLKVQAHARVACSCCCYSTRSARLLT